MVRGAAFRCLRAPGGAAAAVVVLIGALSAAASTASAQSGRPYMPSGYGVSATYVAPAVPYVAPRAPATSSIRGLWIPGLVGLPVAWIATWAHASLSLTAGSDGVNVAFIPIAGPWLVLAAQSVDAPYYVVTGIVQDVSLICLVLGLAIRVPEPRARMALGSATLEVRAAGSALSATIQF